MKFMLAFDIGSNPQLRDQAIERFQRTGGKPPAGAKLLGRWTRQDFSGGFVLLESDNPNAMTEFALMWSDLLPLSLIPVVDDEELNVILKTRLR